MKAIDYSHHGSPALTERSPEYPAEWGERVPMVVRIKKGVKSDLTFSDSNVVNGKEYYCWVNRLGAVAACTSRGNFGLQPGEFEVVAWHNEKPTHGLSVPYDQRDWPATLRRLGELLFEMQPGNLMLVRVEPEGMTAKESIYLIDSSSVKVTDLPPDDGEKHPYIKVTCEHALCHLCKSNKTELEPGCGAEWTEQYEWTCNTFRPYMNLNKLIHAPPTAPLTAEQCIRVLELYKGKQYPAGSPVRELMDRCIERLTALAEKDGE